MTYLGPELTLRLQILPEAFRADWTEDQRSRYGEAEWIDRVAELTVTESAGPMPDSVWAQLVRRKGAWVDDLSVDLRAAEPPDTFHHYFIVADDDSEVSNGTIVRGQVWDSDETPGFEIIYGWRSGDDSWRYIGANRVTYLGPKFEARWFRLALLGRMSSLGFADRELSDGFVDAICGAEDHSAALCESRSFSSATRSSFGPL